MEIEEPKLFCMRTDVLLEDLNDKALEDLLERAVVREFEELGLDPSTISWEQAKKIYSYVQVDLCSYGLDYGLLYMHPELV